MTQNNTHLNEAFLDDAATEALGAHALEESDAFAIALAKADEPHRQATRQIRDTVARMAGIAPYMEPPTALRGAILAATAPKSFKIEEYRRNNDIAPKWLRRSLVASIGFLIFAAWYNASAKNAIDKLTADNTKMVGDMKVAETHYNSMVEQNVALNQALNTAQTTLANAVQANPNALHGLVQDTLGKKHVLLQDPATAQYIVLFADQAVAPNQYVTLSRVGTDGKVEQFKALAVGQPDAHNNNFLANNNPINAQWIGITGDQTAPKSAGFRP